MRILLITLLAASSIAHAAEPFFTFAMESKSFDSTTMSVVAKYFSPTDYLGRRAVIKSSELTDVVPMSHQIQFSSDIAGIQQYMQRGCTPTTPGVFFYHWGDPGKTPASELADPVGSVARAAASAHTGGCNLFGLIPEGSFFGVTGCSSNPAAALYQKIDWTAIDYVDITAGGLLRDDCAADTSLQNYVTLTKTIAAYLKTKNPKIIVAAHLSFRETPPPIMLQAIHELSSEEDGFWLAYPMNTEQERKYCTAQNLETLLSSVRRP